MREARCRGSLWSQYQQEPQPGALNYLSLLTRPRPDMLGIRSALLAGGRETASLARPFCCQHLVTGLLFNRIFRFPGSWIWPHTTDDPHLIRFLKLLLSWSLIMQAKFSQHWGGPVFPKLWVLGFRKNQDLADITLRSSNMRKN